MRWRWQSRAMTVYPDGDALSERELRILQEIERGIEAEVDVLAVHHDLTPIHVVALYALMAEVALAFTGYVSMVALATMASAAWTVAVQGMRVPTGRL